MRDDMVRKIGEEIDRGITTESQVVYMLVKIRKLLDLDQDSSSNFEMLRLCCNWVVHVKLTKPPAQKLVKIAGSFLVKHILNGQGTEEEINEFRNIFSLIRFREELNQFLNSKRLPALGDRLWDSFLSGFLTAIEDCPLFFIGASSEVDEVVLMRDSVASDRDKAGPPILWALCSGGQLKFPVGNVDMISDETMERILAFNRSRKEGQVGVDA